MTVDYDNPEVSLVKRVEALLAENYTIPNPSTNLLHAALETLPIQPYSASIDLGIRRGDGGIEYLERCNKRRVLPYSIARLEYGVRSGIYHWTDTRYDLYGERTSDDQLLQRVFDAQIEGMIEGGSVSDVHINIFNDTTRTAFGRLKPIYERLKAKGLDVQIAEFYLSETTLPHHSRDVEFNHDSLAIGWKTSMTSEQIDQLIAWFNNLKELHSIVQLSS